MSTTVSVDPLLSACQGEVLTPGEDRYEQICAGWNLAWTQRPAVVVDACSEQDVVEAVRFAASHSLSIAVQSTGHGVAIPADEESLLILTRGLDEVRVDPGEGTVTVGGGAVWTAVLPAAQEHGLAPLVGSAPHTGTVGYSLGGGFGWLGRQHGLAVDAVRSLRVVLADGRTVTTSPTEEPELFWAMCGSGGGTLGVVTQMVIDLAPVAEVYAGNLFYPFEAATDVFDRYVEWSQRAPLGLTSAFNLTSFPPIDLVPEPMRGKSFAIVRGCYTGEEAAAAGKELVDEWRSWQAPLMDSWAMMPFARCAEISMDPVDPVPAASTGRWLRGIDRTVLEAMLAAMAHDGGPSPMLLAEVRHAGGAMEAPNPAVSFSARGGDRMLELVGMITGPGVADELDRRFASTWERLDPVLAPLSGFLNFVEGHERVKAAQLSFDAATGERLAAAKRHYDPANLFRHGIALATLGG